MEQRQLLGTRGSACPVRALQCSDTGRHRAAIPAARALPFGPGEELPDGTEVGAAGISVANSAEEELIGGEDGRLPGARNMEKRGVGAGRRAAVRGSP